VRGLLLLSGGVRAPSRATPVRLGLAAHRRNVLKKETLATARAPFASARDEYAAQILPCQPTRAVRAPPASGPFCHNLFILPCFSAWRIRRCRLT